QICRRQRLEFALSLLPYDPEMVQLSEAQRKVEEIIARLRLDETLTEEDSDEDKLRRQKDANDFADLAMSQIELIDSGKLTTLETLTLAAKKLHRTHGNVQLVEVKIPFKYITFLEAERDELMRNNIETVNEARLKLLQQWERSKRKAMSLLTVEIHKVQELEKEQEEQTQEEDEEEGEEEQCSEQTGDLKPKTEHFEMFCDGADELNTSTPKTNDEDLGLDDDDEDYVPEGGDSSNKRKRTKKPVTSTPQAKRFRPGFEFDQDQDSPLIMIGPNGTKVSRASLGAINWGMTGPSITRKLLCEIFDRDTLAHHTLSGKPSPAFRDCARPSKQQLDPLKVADLVYLMTSSLDMTPREVRTAITTKCADENKMLRSRQLRHKFK
ncbi:hypothetical protein KR009_010417, partial [Drosophila setifemur]